MPMNIRTKALGCARGGRVILSGISFNLAAGTCLVLRGPNGAGKTTLLRTLAGLLPPHKGTLQIDSDQIAYAGHLDAVKAQMTVAENLAFWAGVYGTGDAKPVLRKLDLAALSDRPAHTLSAGQHRRVNLARLYLSRAPLWLLDEPFTAIDKDGVAELERLLVCHASAGNAVILTSHQSLSVSYPVSMLSLQTGVAA